MKNLLLVLAICVLAFNSGFTQKKKKRGSEEIKINIPDLNKYYESVKWRSIGPFRGGRSVGSAGVVGDPLTYYMGTTGGGLWKTEDGGHYWKNISDGYFKTGSVGAVAVAESDPNVVYVGMGEHAPRGVMTSYGDGVYKSTDAGMTWQYLGLEMTRHISNIRIHPSNPDVVYVAAQGAAHGPNAERGVYRTTDGGVTWAKVLYIDDNTGCSSLSMDMSNPRILYAGMWDHRRLPWQIRSGGPGSGIYKSTDSGSTWVKIQDGLPDQMGKIGIDVSRANPEKVYAIVEGDTEQEKGGLFVSNNSGETWARVSKDHRLVQRAWYYIEVFADPAEENTVYVLNAPALKSIDGGKTWTRITGTHGDFHDLWINPDNNRNLLISNDGGAAVSFNGGELWSRQTFATAQFYRLNTDNHWPYRIYAGQQDNSSVRIDSRNPDGGSITDKNWTSSAGGESAFLAFDPDNPTLVLGGSYQGTLEALDIEAGSGTSAMAAPIQYLAMEAKDMKYRFNWNAPVIWSRHEPNTFYHGAQKLLKTTNKGVTWTEVSPDLTQNEKSKQGKGGAPLTNEGAGGENYGTLTYVVESPYEAGVIWTGSDDGLVHITRNGGESWENVTPMGLQECLINAIELSPHDPGTAYIATTRYKFNDFAPSAFKTTDYGKSWTPISSGIPYGAFIRVVREDEKRKDLLFAGTETGLYVSFNGGQNWIPFQLNLPVTPILDLLVRHNDIIAATSGRSFWILDDLPLIRQFTNIAEDYHIYQPEDVYRVFAGSPLNQTDMDFDGSNLTAGVNPASGAVIYYTLPDLADSVEVQLELFNTEGELVRQYSSLEKDFIEYDGGPSKDPLLSMSKGLNRFVWDLRYPTLTGTPKAYMEGSFQGHVAPPGQYNVILSYADQKIRTSFRILPDPRIKANSDDYFKQHETMMRIANTVNAMHEAVNTLQRIKEQLHSLEDRIEDDEALGNSLTQLYKSIDKWDEKIVQRKSKSYDDVINFENGLSAYYLFVKSNLSSNIPIVTDGAVEQLVSLDKQWGFLYDEYMIIMNSAREFNRKAMEAGLNFIDLPE